MTDTKRIAAIARALADDGVPNDLDVPPQPWEERRGLSAALGRLHARSVSWVDMPAGKRATWAEHSASWTDPRTTRSSTAFPVMMTSRVVNC